MTHLSQSSSPLGGLLGAAPGRKRRSLLACGSIWLAAGVCSAAGGCRSPASRMAPLDPVPMAEAARLVNDNNAKITATLRATGSVDGRFTLPDGRTRRYHVDGVLFYLAPHYLRFDLCSSAYHRRTASTVFSSFTRTA